MLYLSHLTLTSSLVFDLAANEDTSYGAAITAEHGNVADTGSDKPANTKRLQADEADYTLASSPDEVPVEEDDSPVLTNLEKIPKDSSRPGAKEKSGQECAVFENSELSDVSLSAESSSDSAKCVSSKSASESSTREEESVEETTKTEREHQASAGSLESPGRAKRSDPSMGHANHEVPGTRASGQSDDEVYMPLRTWKEKRIQDIRRRMARQRVQGRKDTLTNRIDARQRFLSSPSSTRQCKRRDRVIAQLYLFLRQPSCEAGRRAKASRLKLGRVSNSSIDRDEAEADRSDMDSEIAGDMSELSQDEDSRHSRGSQTVPNVDKPDSLSSHVESIDVVAQEMHQDSRPLLQRQRVVSHHQNGSNLSAATERNHSNRASQDCGDKKSSQSQLVVVPSVQPRCLPRDRRSHFVLSRPWNLERSKLVTSFAPSFKMAEQKSVQIPIKGFLAPGHHMNVSLNFTESTEDAVASDTTLQSFSTIGKMHLRVRSALKATLWWKGYDKHSSYGSVTDRSGPLKNDTTLKWENSSRVGRKRNAEPRGFWKSEVWRKFRLLESFLLTQASTVDKQRKDRSGDRWLLEGARDKPFNFASFDAGARVLTSSANAVGAKNTLTNNPDQYMLMPCVGDGIMGSRWIDIELSEEIVVTSFETANFEFYSSFPQRVAVLGATSYPPKRWYVLGIFNFKNVRTIQRFVIDKRSVARYLRVVYAGKQGNEYYCPVSVVRVYGKTLIADWKDALNPSRSSASEADGLASTGMAEAVPRRQGEATQTTQQPHPDEHCQSRRMKRTWDGAAAKLTTEEISGWDGVAIDGEDSFRLRARHVVDDNNPDMRGTRADDGEHENSVAGSVRSDSLRDKSDGNVLDSVESASKNRDAGSKIAKSEGQTSSVPGQDSDHDGRESTQTAGVDEPRHVASNTHKGSASKHESSHAFSKQRSGDTSDDVSEEDLELLHVFRDETLSPSSNEENIFRKVTRMIRLLELNQSLTNQYIDTHLAKYVNALTNIRMEAQRAHEEAAMARSRLAALASSMQASVDQIARSALKRDILICVLLVLVALLIGAHCVLWAAFSGVQLHNIAHLDGEDSRNGLTSVILDTPDHGMNDSRRSGSKRKGRKNKDKGQPRIPRSPLFQRANTADSLSLGSTPTRDAAIGASSSETRPSRKKQDFSDSSRTASNFGSSERSVNHSNCFRIPDTDRDAGESRASMTRSWSTDLSSRQLVEGKKHSQ